MVEVIDERLRQRHGIVLTRDPDAARAVLGETLFQFTQVPAKISSPRELAVLIDLMEAV
jgi:hypothetical protein